MSEPDAATAHAWAALGGPPELVERVAWTGAPGLRRGLPVRELARATVGAASLAAAELLAQRTGHAMADVRVDEGAVAVAFTSERHLRVDGRPIPLFAPLSGFWPSADGWVRTHANYPHHRARLLSALGLADSGDDADLVDAARPPRSRERAVGGRAGEPRTRAGGLAVAVRPSG